MSETRIAGSEELDLFNTLCINSGIEVEYKQEDRTIAGVACVPYKVRADRLDFGVPLYADSRIFLFRKNDLPEPQPGDLIQWGNDTWRVCSVPDGPHYVEHGRFGHLLKLHTRRSYSDA